jgi:CRISPR-associated protein Cmr2
MTKYLFLCTIGPVQSFISQARKTRDLYSGSRLLSKLVKIGMDLLPPENIIFPAPHHNTSYPNRFLAILQNEALLPREFGQKVELEIQNGLKKIAESVLEKQGVEESVPGFFEQLETQLEIFWLALPLEEVAEAPYEKVYPDIEATLGAMKNVRPFQQLVYQKVTSEGIFSPESGSLQVGESGRKCSLDGERNALFYRSRDAQSNAPFIITQLNNAQLIEGHQLRPGEGLSAISFIKRMWDPEDAEFDSVSSIALSDTLMRLRSFSPEVEAAIEFLKSLNDQFLYKSFTDDPKSKEKLLKEAASNVSPGVIESYQQVLWSAADKMKENKKEELVFTPYYAVLRFDGDQMGAWLSGDSDLLVEDVDLLSFHRELSDCLGQFASEAKNKVEEGGRIKGRSIYAGGDDLMAFVNLNHIFPLLSELRLLFRELVGKALASYCKAGKELSFSAGICIAHVKEPLGIVLNEAKHMEEKAKNRFKDQGKDGFGIKLLKAAGERHETFWRFFGADSNNLLSLHTLAGTLRKGDFSDKFITSLDRTYQPLSFEGIIELPVAVIKEDIKRLISRAYNGSVKNKKEACPNLEKIIFDLLDQSPRDWNNFINALHIVNFIENELNLSYDNKDESH